nr:d4.2 [Tranosema rostrale ichnovirus]
MVRVPSCVLLLGIYEYLQRKLLRRINSVRYVQLNLQTYDWVLIKTQTALLRYYCPLEPMIHEADCQIDPGLLSTKSCESPNVATLPGAKCLTASTARDANCDSYKLDISPMLAYSNFSSLEAGTHQSRSHCAQLLYAAACHRLNFLTVAALTGPKYSAV